MFAFLGMLASMLLAAAMVLALDTSLRADVLHLLITLAKSHVVHVIGFGGLAVIFVVTEIADRADQFKFIREVIQWITGYSPEAAEIHVRDFAKVPDDYISRPQLEHHLAEALQPSDTPRFVVLHGEPDSGKTALLSYVVPRRLSRKYRGRVIYCRGDRQSIDVGPAESDEEVRKKLAQRVLLRIVDEAEVPGDVGESITAMSSAISYHFHHEDHPWLIVIDDTDDTAFPFDVVLPALSGTSNTIVVASHLPLLSRVYARPILQAPPRSVEVPMRPFNSRQAAALLAAELRKRHKRLSRRLLRSLAPHLKGTSPGTIQRLSDAYRFDDAYTGVVALSRTLDSSSTEEEEDRAKAIAQLTTARYSTSERYFIAALALIRGPSVSIQALQAIAASSPDGSPDPYSLIQMAISHSYLESQAPVAHHKEPSDRYSVTKLGHAMAHVARQRAHSDFELLAGSALLDFYRRVERGKERIDLVSELPTILGAMEWAQYAPRTIPDSDAINFIRMLRRAFYPAGAWSVGTQWLTYSAQLTDEQERPCSLGDLLASQARLDLSRGFPQRAIENIARARKAYKRSEANAEADMLLAVSFSDQLARSITYTRLQRIWLVHLEAQALRATVPTDLNHAYLDAISERLRSALEELRSIPNNNGTDHTTLADRLRLSLEGDQPAVTILSGDRERLQGTMGEAARLWRQAQVEARAVRRLATQFARIHGIDVEIQYVLVHALRLEGTAYGRLALGASRLAGAFWRRRGARLLRKSLKIANTFPSPYEASLTLQALGRLTVGGAPNSLLAIAPEVKEDSLRRSFARLDPTWNRMSVAAQLLRQGNAAASRLGALALQVRCLTTLIDLELRLWQRDTDPVHLTAAKEYAEAACSILDRLQTAAPELNRYRERIPIWLRPRHMHQAA
jgi:hypothetical protein